MRVEDKPRIKCLRKWDDKVYYKCTDKRVEAYGSTPEEAYEMWKLVSAVKEWKAQQVQHYPTQIQPFSLLKWVETSYSDSSVPLKITK